MAASDLIQDDDQPHVEVTVTDTGPSAPPPPPSDGGDDANKLSNLIKELHSLNGLRRNGDYTKITLSPDRPSRLPQEWWKTGVAFLYALFNLVFTTVVITVVHERVPDTSVSPPLPDKFFDYVARVPWAFTVTEVNGLILVGLWSVQWLFLKHK